MPPRARNGSKPAAKPAVIAEPVVEEKPLIPTQPTEVTLTPDQIQTAEKRLDALMGRTTDDEQEEAGEEEAGEEEAGEEEAGEEEAGEEEVGEEPKESHDDVEPPPKKTRKPRAKMTDEEKAARKLAREGQPKKERRKLTDEEKAARKEAREKKADKAEKADKDEKPKREPSAYNLYVQKMMPLLKIEFADAEPKMNQRDLMKIVGERWTAEKIAAGAMK